MKHKTIAEIKKMLADSTVDSGIINRLRQDTRKGVKQVLTAYDRKQERLQRMLEAQEIKRQFDRRFSPGETLIAGVDEAGRGPLAGPVTAAAVILPEDFSLPGLTDSKQLTATERERFNQIIIKEAVAFHVAVIEREVIDRLNIYEATKLAMREAIVALRPIPNVALVDAVELRIPSTRTEAIIKGDDLSLSIAAASILAKVKRDNIMTELDEAFPAYELKHNKGYGTKAHLSALERHGPSPCHRRSFAPVTTILKEGS